MEALVAVGFVLLRNIAWQISGRKTLVLSGDSKYYFRWLDFYEMLYLFSR